MGKTIFKGKYKEHDLTVTVDNPGVLDGLILEIETAALSQVPLSSELYDKFCELRDVGFFIPYAGVTEPETGGIEPCGWSCISYSVGPFIKLRNDAPAWIKDVANSKTPEERFNYHRRQWSHIKVEAACAKSSYALNKLIYYEATKNGIIQINGYQARSAIEVLELILPEKYKINQLAS